MNNLLSTLFPRSHQYWHSTIRTRLIVVISVLIAAISLFIYLHFPAALQKQELKSYAKSASSIAERTAYSIAPALYFMDISNIDEVLSSVRQNPDLEYILVMNDSGRIVASYKQENADTTNLGQVIGHQEYVISKDGLVLCTQAPIAINALHIGKIVLGLSLTDMRKAINDSKKTTALVSLIILIAGIFTVIGVSAMLTRPLNHMVDKFEQIAAGDFSHRANVSSSYEVNRLANSFNQMVDKLQVSQNQLEQINQDLENRVQQRTHELRKEIVQRKSNEKKIIASLHEKEVLLKEIHHRVKNNLQIIQSLLYLQSQNIKDKQALSYFTESVNRVRSIALLHEKLYKSNDLAQINFPDYVRDLVQGIYQAFDFHNNFVEFDIQVSSFYLGIDSAIPCGLIINELVSNSLKHAFKKTANKQNMIRIIINMLEDKNMSISIQDNGQGIPSDMDIHNNTTLGLRLVTSLVETQLNGKLELDVSSGTKFNITIKL